MSVDQPFVIYREQLSSKYHGLALWDPQPVDNLHKQPGHVSIGDVGYLDNGAFMRMFNVTLPWDDPSNKLLGKPGKYEPIKPSHFGNDSVRDKEIREGEYYTPHVSKVDNVGADRHEDSIGQMYQCGAQHRGALLFLPHKGHRKDVIPIKVFENYIKDNVDNWFLWSKEMMLPVEHMEDLILVTGCTLVTSWAAAAFDNHMSADSDATTISLEARKSDGGGAQFFWRNIRGNVEYHNSRFDPSVQGPLPQDQCVFIRGFRAKRSFFRTRPMRAAAEPLPDEPDDRRGDEMQVTRIPDSSKYRDPLSGVLDYIIEKCREDVSAAEDIIAIAHDDDLQFIEGVGILTADAVENFLREKKVPLLVENGAAILRDQAGNGPPVSDEKKTIFYAARSLSLLPPLRVLDRDDNPYMPRHLQQAPLNLDPGDFALLHPIPELPPDNLGSIAGAHEPIITTVTTSPVHNDADELDDIDDDSSDSPDSIKDHEFPSFFSTRGSPPRLFYSHGTYSLPVDGDEMKRQEAQHILLRMILGSNYDAPIHQLLNNNSCERKVVDLCTGAGHWVLDMAKEFPHVEFRGLDLVPIQTRYPPRNVRFEIADVTERLRFADASVDVVHARMACLRAEVVPHFLQEVARVLRTGGFFLSAEWGIHPTLHPVHPSFANDDVYIPKTVSFYKAASDIVPSLAPQILRLIRQTAPFEQPVSKQWAIPISTPYTPDIPISAAFVSGVMGRITQGYADALVAGGSLLQEDADAFNDELGRGFGIYIMYQTVFARKKCERMAVRGTLSPPSHEPTGTSIALQHCDTACDMDSYEVLGSIL